MIQLSKGGVVMGNMKYCPKCGHIAVSQFDRCSLCRTNLFEINPKWGITEEKYYEFMDLEKYGEKTRQECKMALYEFCTPFFDEVVKKRPEFDQELFDTLIEREEKYYKELHTLGDEFAKGYEKNQPLSKSKPTIKCPYCSSTNTKKLSSMSRMFSGGLFGLGSGKIGKQWHCNSCGSDF